MCNSYANVFPIDDIQTWKNDNGPVSRTGYVKLSLGFKKLVWSWMLQHGSEVHATSHSLCSATNNMIKHLSLISAIKTTSLIYRAQWMKGVATIHSLWSWLRYSWKLMRSLLFCFYYLLLFIYFFHHLLSPVKSFCLRICAMYSTPLPANVGTNCGDPTKWHFFLLGLNCLPLWGCRNWPADVGILVDNSSF